MNSDIFMAYLEPAIREYIKKILSHSKLDIEDIWWGKGLKCAAYRNGLIIGLGKFHLPLWQICEIMKCTETYARNVLEDARKHPTIHERINTFRWVNA